LASDKKFSYAAVTPEQVHSVLADMDLREMPEVERQLAPTWMPDQVRMTSLFCRR
jgi:metal-sulfur cluster biosynthetic enzyme